MIEDLQHKVPDDVTNYRWLVTGAAGFIGSNLVDMLLTLGCSVRGFDNFTTGKGENITDIERLKTKGDFEFVNGDICKMEDCVAACDGIDRVVHLAALGSVPESLESPHFTNDVNVSGFVNLMTAARDSDVQRFVYASSCSVYGDQDNLPISETSAQSPMSPYALTKLINERYAALFADCYGFETVGLRFFNVYGPRQDPHGAYASVIPFWLKSLARGETIFINGDGSVSRDFCYVEDVARAIILSGVLRNPERPDLVFNVGTGKETTLLELAQAMLKISNQSAENIKHREFRAGDIQRSRADTSRIEEKLGFKARVGLEEGLLHTFKRMNGNSN